MQSIWTIFLINCLKFEIIPKLKKDSSLSHALKEDNKITTHNNKNEYYW